MIRAPLVIFGVAIVAIGAVVIGIHHLPTRPSLTRSVAASLDRQNQNFSTLPVPADLSMTPLPPEHPAASVQDADTFWERRVLALLATLGPHALEKDYDSVVDLLAGQQDFALAQSVLAQVPEHRLRQKLLSQLVLRWAADRPAATADWMCSLPAPFEPLDSTFSVMRVWSDADPHSSADYIAQLPPGPLRTDALAGAIGSWARVDAAAAAAWLNQAQRTPEFDHAIYELISSPSVLHGDRTVALSWAGSISDAAQRRQAIELVAADWASKDKTSAFEYVRNCPALDADQRVAVLHDLDLLAAEQW